MDKKIDRRTHALIIMDGYGISEREKGNAIRSANTPNLDRFLERCPNSIVHTSGMEVGLPEGQMGNSEVGHANIGAGRIVYQELTRITKSIDDGDFFENDALLCAVQNCKINDSAFHIMGLLSNGGVHSHISHIYALLKLAKQNDLHKVYVHCFLDGRDVAPDSGVEFVSGLVEKMRELGVGDIATVMGRYYAMDRDNRWDRVLKAYRAMVYGEGNQAQSAVTVVNQFYNKNITDEFIEPTVIVRSDVPVGLIAENDSVIFSNFRPDRAREITSAFVDMDFDHFKREFKKLNFVCMTQYCETMPNVSIAFAPNRVTDTLGEYLSKLGLSQLRIAETEKYAHVTFFFNGGVEAPYYGEDRVMIPSPDVSTYDLKPEMSAFEVADEAVKRVLSCKYDVIVLNFANCDMVGHTGNFEAAVRAVEVVDDCVGKVVDAILRVGGDALITADHGNSEQMLDYGNGHFFTAHTSNVVPLMLVGSDKYELRNGRLADLAPTLLELMGLDKPKMMTGESLLSKI